MEEVKLTQGLNYVGVCMELGASQADIAKASGDNSSVGCGTRRLLVKGSAILDTGRCPVLVEDPMTIPRYTGHCILTCDVAIMPRRFMEPPASA
jgi:hypothetical protein